jgi:DNA-binding CsgD family transcriptional regulator
LRITFRQHNEKIAARGQRNNMICNSEPTSNCHFIINMKSLLLVEFLSLSLKSKYPKSNIKVHQNIHLLDILDHVKSGDETVWITDSKTLDSMTVRGCNARSPQPTQRLSLLVLCSSRHSLREAPSLLGINGGFALLDATSCSLDRLFVAIESVLSGFTMISSSDDGSLVSPLTDPEQEVWGHLARGASNAHIAAQMHVSEKTVERTLRTLYQKLGVAGNGSELNPRVAATLRYHGV